MADERETPFRYLTSEEFSALTDMERITYLKKKNDHLAERNALLKKPEKPKKS